MNTTRVLEEKLTFYRCYAPAFDFTHDAHGHNHEGGERYKEAKRYPYG